MNSYDYLLIRYGELSLKGSNRSLFEKQLISNIEKTVDGLAHGRVTRCQGGIRAELQRDSPVLKICQRLQKTAGIAWLAPCWGTDRTLENIAKTVLKNAESQISGAETFAIDTQRSDKSFRLNSEQINTKLGSRVERQTGLSVDLDQPDWKVNVHILREQAYVFFRRYEGIHGLPMGSTGPVLSQLSGGIDSPVASILSIRRGCQADLIHFYPYPSADQALEKGMGDRLRVLAPYTTKSRIFMVPYHPFELRTSKIPGHSEILLFRRHTLRVSEMIANRHDHQALITGESLGQVASQTLSNIKSIGNTIDMPIYRPLSGLNKNEIIEYARRFGTYEPSIQDYRDCCSIQSRHPRTNSRISQIRSMEEQYEIESVDRQAIDETEIYRISAASADPEKISPSPENFRHEQAI